MQIHQLQVKFLPEEDRLLLSILTSNNQEFLLLLTRRFVKRALPVLVDILATEAKVQVPADPTAQQAVLSMQHDDAISKVDFHQAYEAAEAVERPMGDAPLLVTVLRLKTLSDQNTAPLLCFHGENKMGVEFGYNNQMLHSFYRMLAECAHTADWDLDIDRDFDNSQSVQRVLN